MQQTIILSTPAPPQADLYGITRQVEAIVAEPATGGPAWSMYMSRERLQGS